jgi:spore germination cell wall hydrolase CwlJ-like protein
MIPFDSMYESVKDFSILCLVRVKSFNYREHTHLIKPTLYYISVSALAASAALYITERNTATKNPTGVVQNISTNITNNSEIKQISYGNNSKGFPNISEEFPNISKGISSKIPNNLRSLSGFQLKEYWCLKVLGWNEIRNGSEYAMKAVYSVVENRKNSGKYPSTYCEVMKQDKQFSFWNQGKYNIKGIEPSPENEKDKVALSRIEKISYKLVTGKFNPVLPSSVLWYSTPAVKERKGSMHWTQQYRVATKAGGHLFYTKPLRSV